MITTVFRLALAEGRKIFTTRGIAAFLIVLAVLGAAIAVIVATLSDSAMVNGAAVVVVLGVLFAIAMPVLGALIFTSDWHNREISYLFLAQPRRGRVFVAKLLAGVIVALLLLAFSSVLAVGVSGLSSFALGRPAVWDGLASGLGPVMAGSTVGLLSGAAIGSAVRNSLAAISFCFLQSLALDPLIGLVPGGLGPYFMLGSISNWLDGSGSVGPASVAAMVWLVLPMSIGWFRHCFSDVQ